MTDKIAMPEVDEDGPAQNLVSTRNGFEIDLNNLPGKARVNLINEGELEVDQFIAPPNMPGLKLKALREQHRERIEKAMGAVKQAQPINDFEKGEVVYFQNEPKEILEVDPDKGVLLERLNKKNELKRVWTSVSKVKRIE